METSLIIGWVGTSRQGQVAVVAAGSVPTTRTGGMVEKTLSTVTLNCLEGFPLVYETTQWIGSQATGSPRPGGHAQHVRRNKSEIAFFSFSSDQGSFCLPANKSSKLGKAARRFPKRQPKVSIPCSALSRFIEKMLYSICCTIVARNKGSKSLYVVRH